MKYPISNNTEKKKKTLILADNWYGTILNVNASNNHNMITWLIIIIIIIE